MPLPAVARCFAFPRLSCTRGNAVTAAYGVPDSLRRRLSKSVTARRQRTLPYVRPQQPATRRWGGRPCPASPSPRRRRRHRQRQERARSARPLLCARLLRRVGACIITRRGGRRRDGEEPAAAAGSWCCGGAPQLASPGRPATAASPGCSTLIHC